MKRRQHANVLKKSNPTMKKRQCRSPEKGESLVVDRRKAVWPEQKGGRGGRSWSASVATGKILALYSNCNQEALLSYK